MLSDGIVVCSLVCILLYCVGLFPKLFTCSLVQHDSRWRHVLFWWDMHRLQVGDMS